MPINMAAPMRMRWFELAACQKPPGSLLVAIPYNTREVMKANDAA